MRGPIKSVAPRRFGRLGAVLRAALLAISKPKSPKSGLQHVSVGAPVETPQNATRTGPAQMAAKKTKRVLMAALSIKGLAMDGK